jgi:GTPase-associated system helical domain
VVSIVVSKPRTEPKLEALRAALMAAAHAHTMKTASTARNRVAVPDITFPAPKEFDATNVELSVKNGAKAAIAALRANAAVDREELDLMWWVLSDRSGLLSRRISTDENKASAAIASGLEAGRMLRRMPADAHLYLALRHVGKAPPLTLPELIKAVGDDRKALIAPFAENPVLVACGSIFPLLTALRTGSATDAKAKVKRALDDWVGRALLESAILHVTSHLPSVAV